MCANDWLEGALELRSSRRCLCSALSLSLMFPMLLYCLARLFPEQQAVVLHAYDSDFTCEQRLTKRFSTVPRVIRSRAQLRL